MSIKIEALIKCSPEETKELSQGSGFDCLIPPSLMFPARDKKSHKALGVPDPVTVNVLGQKLEVSKGAAIWEKKDGKDILIFKCGGSEVGRHYVHPSDYFRVFVYADPSNSMGKLYPVEIKVRSD